MDNLLSLPKLHLLHSLHLLSSICIMFSVVHAYKNYLIPYRNGSCTYSQKKEKGDMKMEVKLVTTLTFVCTIYKQGLVRIGPQWFSTFTKLVFHPLPTKDPDCHSDNYRSPQTIIIAGQQHETELPLFNKSFFSAFV